MQPFPRLDVARILAVAIAAGSLAVSLPNIVANLVPMYGSFGYFLDDDDRVVAVVGGRALHAGVKVGDRVDQSALPPNSRYFGGLGRLPLIGTVSTIPFVRDGVVRRVTLKADYYPQFWQLDGYRLAILLLKKAAAAVLVLIAVALVLVRPTRTTAAFYLYAIGSTYTTYPVFYSFLPLWGFIAISALADAFFAVAAVGFLLLALRLPRDPPIGWRRVVERAAPVVLLAAAAPFVVGDVLSGLGLPDQSIIIAAEYVQLVAYATAVASLLMALFDRTLLIRPGTRVAICGLALAAVGPIVAVVAAVLPRLPFAIPPILVGDLPYAYGVIVSLFVAYVLVRYRVIDVQLVVDRSLVYAVMAFLVVAAFAGVNAVFARQWAHVAFIIPLEIVAAVLLGYRLSGLRDVATALSLAGIDAPRAASQGRRAEERELLARALERAERVRRRGIVAEVRARAAFSAWVNAEAEEFDRQVSALASVVGSARMRGLKLLVRAASGSLGQDEATDADLPEWVARAYLVGCGTSSGSPEALRSAESAFAAAEASANPHLQTLGCIALAEFDPQRRIALYEAAIRHAEIAGSLPLQQSVRAIERQSNELGLLAGFVAQLRAPRARTPAFVVRFLTAQVFRNGSVLALRDSEAALLFALARRPGPISSDALVDRLWPELDGDAAANALRVCVYRLRRALGEPRAVVTAGKGYELETGVAVDLRSINAAVDDARAVSVLSTAERAKLRDIHTRLQGTRAERAAQPPWFSSYAEELSALMREAAYILTEDALGRGHAADAIALARGLVDDDPFDEGARNNVIRAQLAANDHAAAKREYRRYCDLLARNGLSGPSRELVALVGDPDSVLARPRSTAGP